MEGKSLIPFIVAQEDVKRCKMASIARKGVNMFWYTQINKRIKSQYPCRLDKSTIVRFRGSSWMLKLSKVLW